MVEAALAAAAFASSYAGFACLALRQRPHRAAVAGSKRHMAHPPAWARRQLLLGCAALALSCACSLLSQGWSFGSILFSFVLSAGALGVLFTLTYRPRWLRPPAWLPGGGEGEVLRNRDRHLNSPKL